MPFGYRRVALGESFTCEKSESNNLGPIIYRSKLCSEKHFSPFVNTYLIATLSGFMANPKRHALIRMCLVSKSGLAGLPDLKDEAFVHRGDDRQLN
jgi:hypothetical protein